MKGKWPYKELDKLVEEKPDIRYAGYEEPEDQWAGYHAIIPGHLRYDKRLPLGARFMYGEITSLCDDTACCWEDKKYFSKLYDVDIKTISKWLKLLEKYGCIEIFSYSNKEKNKKVIHMLFV